MLEDQLEKQLLFCEVWAPQITVLLFYTLHLYSNKLIPRPVKSYTKLSPQNDVGGKFNLNAKAFGSKDQRVNVMQFIVVL